MVFLAVPEGGLKVLAISMESAWTHVMAAARGSDYKALKARVQVEFKFH